MLYTEFRHGQTEVATACMYTTDDAVRDRAVELAGVGCNVVVAIHDAWSQRLGIATPAWYSLAA